MDRAVGYIVSKRISPAARILWLVLEGVGAWSHGIPRLARYLNRSEPSIKLDLDELEAHKLLTVSRAKNGKAHTYEALWR